MLKRNADLEQRVAELEVELHVWKQAHSVALEASEAHNVQIAALNRQISGLDYFKSVRIALSSYAPHSRTDNVTCRTKIR